jgi:hypothetical protein
MSKQDQTSSNQISPSTRAWCDQARAIVAYPEDFGMSRRDVRGLQQLLTAVEQPLDAGRCEYQPIQAA